MSESFILPSLFLSQIRGSESRSILEKELIKWINREPVQMDELLHDCTWQEVLMSADKTIENWKRLLAVNLLNREARTHFSEMTSKIGHFEKQPWNQSSQFFRLLVALNHQLARMPIPEVGIQLLESGAAPIELQEYSPWLSLPYHPYHLEFGIYLCALGVDSQRYSYVRDAARLAAWQLNTLDSRGYPIAALFVREKDGNYFELLLLHYLLFRAAASYCKEAKFAHFASLLGLHVKESFKGSKTPIHPLWVLLESLFDYSAAPDGSKFELPSQIYDSSTALIGYREERQCALCTLHGGHTGLGYQRYRDVEIVNYGPQYFPLDDCRGFGIEANHLSDQGMRRTSLEWNKQGFAIKGCVRLVDQPGPEDWQIGRFRGIWLDIVQEYSVSQMHVKATLLGLEGWEGVGFCYFVKASKCVINEFCELIPGKPDVYRGVIQPLKLVGLEGGIEIQALSQKGTMQVIPLSGGDIFWGANFLVAYVLDPNTRHYGWTMNAISLPE